MQNLFSASGSADNSLGASEGRWYTVGRLNYNQQESRLVDALVGVEYDAGCWLGRVVSERLQVTDGLARQRLLFQLELVGLARGGSSPLAVLRNSIPRYQDLRDNPLQPSRFQNYE